MYIRGVDLTQFRPKGARCLPGIGAAGPTFPFSSSPKPEPRSFAIPEFRYTPPMRTIGKLLLNVIIGSAIFMASFGFFTLPMNADMAYFCLVLIVTMSGMVALLGRRMRAQPWRHFILFICLSIAFFAAMIFARAKLVSFCLFAQLLLLPASFTEALFAWKQHTGKQEIFKAFFTGALCLAVAYVLHSHEGLGYVIPFFILGFSSQLSVAIVNRTEKT